jgi:hypothetical protein
MNKLQHAILTFLAYHVDVPEENARIRAVFEKFDTNHDQVINKEEFKKGTRLFSHLS